MRHILIATTCLILLGAPWHAAAGDVAPGGCELEAVEGAVVCINKDGEQVWELHHPSLWPDEEAYLAGEEGAVPVGPIHLDDAAFYGVNRDLIQIDAATGVVEDRLRLTGTIRQLDVVDDALEVVTGRAASAPMTITPGEPPPPQRALSMGDLTRTPSTARDAQWLAAQADDPDQAMRLLEQAHRADPTNPFFQQVMGMVLLEEGDDQGASQAFAAAADTPNALWRDLMRLSSNLDELGVHDQAENALQQGIRQMEAFGIGEEDLLTFLPMAAMALGSRDEIDQIISAVEDGDFAEAYRRALGFADTLPELADVSAEWQQLIDDNKRAAYEIVEEAAVDLDGLMLPFAAALFALLLLVLLAGLRIGATRRLRVGDALVPLLLFIGLLAIPYLAMPHAHVAQSFVDLPISEIQQHPDSPEARQKLFDMADDPAVRQFLTAFMAERQAAAAGEPLPERIAVVRLLADAAYLEAEEQKWDLLHQGRMPDLVAMAAMIKEEPQTWELPRTISLAYALIPAAALLILMLLAAMVGRMAPGVIRPVLLIFPGGALRLTTLSALMLVALIAALCALAGLDSLFQQRGLPEVAQLLELDDVDPRQLPSRTWAFMTLAAATIVHVALVGLQWVRRGDDQRPNASPKK